MNLFFGYLKQRRRGIALFIAFSAIFTITFILYRLPIKAVLYPVCLCIIFGVLAVAADIIRIKRKQDTLLRLRSFSDISEDNFPKQDGIEDKVYQDIIRLLNEEYTQFVTESESKYLGMIDYYTVWAHQIKTPIAAMRLTLQNEDTPLSRKLSNDLARIEMYVGMVLAYLRLDSKSSDYVIKEYSLDGIIKQAVKKFSGEFIERKLSLNYEPTDLNIVTDEKWLSFVIEQVISNALKYTPHGGISIFAENGRLHIKDTGIGIAAGDLPRIFENGYTGYNGRTDKHASGIGLYLCKRICGKLRYDIKVKSTVGKGTEIIIDMKILQKC